MSHHVFHSTLAMLYLWPPFLFTNAVSSCLSYSMWSGFMRTVLCVTSHSFSVFGNSNKSYCRSQTELLLWSSLINIWQSLFHEWVLWETETLKNYAIWQSEFVKNKDDMLNMGKCTSRLKIVVKSKPWTKFDYKFPRCLLDNTAKLKTTL